MKRWGRSCGTCGSAWFAWTLLVPPVWFLAVTPGCAPRVQKIRPGGPTTVRSVAKELSGSNLVDASTPLSTLVRVWTPKSTPSLMSRLLRKLRNEYWTWIWSSWTSEPSMRFSRRASYIWTHPLSPPLSPPPSPPLTREPPPIPNQTLDPFLRTVTPHPCLRTFLRRPRPCPQAAASSCTRAARLFPPPCLRARSLPRPRCLQAATV
mmetsp:Transcript_6072/g.8226  ORF Transcript_6072/g.8226 Transcript_6072/m.8226 type:complete len:207 (-) Transcript_6072:58-678(-)